MGEPRVAASRDEDVVYDGDFRLAYYPDPPGLLEPDFILPERPMRAVQIVRSSWSSALSLVHYWCEDLTTGEEVCLTYDMLGERLNEMEVLAWVSR